jgi:tripartite-type tricarboxylate transporter receptor subunit TctC
MLKTLRYLSAAAALSALAAFAVPHESLAQQFPTKTVTMVGGYPAGAASDTLARAISDQLQQQWGQPVVIDNRPGSSGNLAATQVARSAPDGHTILVATDAMLTSNAFLFKAIAFDPVKDFEPVLNAAKNILVLAVHPSQPIKSVADYIAEAKKNPGKMAFASSGPGSPHHLAGELLAQKAGIKLQHIPYKGGGQAINDLAGGHVPSGFLSLSAARALHDSGKIRIIGVAEPARFSELPDIPTIAETVPGVEMGSFVALMVPAGTPKEVVNKISESAAKILKDSAVSKRLAGAGLVVTANPPADLAKTIKDGLAVRGELIKAAGIKPAE